MIICVCVFPTEHTPQEPEASPESEAFQRVYCDIFSYILDNDPHLTIVNRLYSSGMIDNTTRDAMTCPRKQRVEQVRSLLKELEDQIELRPAIYQEIISLLKKGGSCELAVLLQQKNGKMEILQVFLGVSFNFVIPCINGHALGYTLFYIALCKSYEWNVMLIM